ncbi:MAG: SRPBCC family protein [Kineosporiaceae bacterium]|nr:SRPBCC family protein [Aeromicrobium sp.]
MSLNKRAVQATSDQVWSVLADGWLYPLWVVGASRIREVDNTWPAEGSSIHHSMGVWPVLIDDRTSVLEANPGSHIRLRARGWPLGEAEVEITLRAEGSHTEIAIAEHPTAGPGVLVPNVINDVLLKWRNTETLRRLAYVVERRPNS